jgi:CRISPR-associated endoribonuclease Cas6
MIYSVILRLKPIGNIPISSGTAYHNYSFFLDLIRKVNPDLANELHEMPGLKPVTVSPLWGKIRPWIRFTFLQETVFSNFAHSLLNFEPEYSFPLGNHEYKVLTLSTNNNSSPWVRFDEFQNIWEHSSLDRKVPMGFRSPTGFRSNGRNVLFPQTDLVFGSLITRWNAYSETVIDNSVVDELLSNVFVSQHTIRTQLLEFGSYRQVGFIGKCTFELPGKSSENAIRCMNALADFALFAGVGAKTTMGMGQTEKLIQGGAND